MTETVHVDGLKEVLANLKKVAEMFGYDKTKGIVRSSLRKAGKVLQKQAQDNLRQGGHVQTGALMDNVITTVERHPDAGIIAMDVTIRARTKKYRNNARNRRLQRVGQRYQDYGPLFYGRFLEFGTSHQKATPFMRPAFEQHKGELPEMIRDDLNQKIEKALA